MAKLVIFQEAAGQETIFEDFELTTNRILIGSELDNHLVLDSPDIDSAHASLEQRNDNWILQDLGGPGGTQVNGLTLDGPYCLQDDDLIELASIKLEFVDDDMWETDSDEEEATEEEDEEDDAKESNSQISGKIWLATLIGGTLAVIFIILFLLIVADILGVIKIIDLLP